MSAKAKRVLVVEDNPALANVVRFNLERCGLSATVARTGQEGWDLLREHRFDLVIMDHQMPVMSGCELCSKMRADERLADTKVIMVTAKGLELELPMLREELRVSAVFPKPFSPTELVAAARRELEEAPLEASEASC